MPLEWHGDKVRVRLTQALERNLWRAGEYLLTKSMNRVPHDTGTLRRSGTVTLGDLPDEGYVYRQAKDGSWMTKAFAGVRSTTRSAVYVSWNTPYARRQHEGDYHHTDGERKWATRTFAEELENVKRLVGVGVRSDMLKPNPAT